MSLYGGTKDGLSLDDVKNYPILLPPRNEQEVAVQWIEGRLSALVKIMSTQSASSKWCANTVPV